MVVQSLGKTTREVRDRYAEGDAFDDFVGRSACRSMWAELATGAVARGRQQHLLRSFVQDARPKVIDGAA